MSALLNGLILSLPFTALVWLMLRLIPRRTLNAATRHAIWWTALTAILALPLLFAPLPRFAQPSPATATDSPVSPMGVIVSRTGPPALARVQVAPAPYFPLRVTTGPWITWLGIAWLIASLLLLLRLVLSYRTLERYKRRAMRLATGPIAVSQEIAAPIAAGPLRRCILIPAKLLGQVSESELEQIIQHETAHLTRRDDVTLLLQRILEALFPWHPALRFATRQMSFEREVACDDFVIASAPTRLYAQCLTHLAELAHSSGPLAANAAAQSRSHLVRRIDMLLDRTRHTGTRLLPMHFAAAGILLACAGWMAAQSPILIALAAPPPRGTLHLLTPSPPPLPLRQWIAQAAPAPPPTVTPVSRPVTLTVTVPVRVIETRQGRIVTGLEREHFRVYEDNVEQEITGFSDSNGPVSVAVVLDSHQNSQDLNSILTRLATGVEGDQFFYSSVHGPLQSLEPAGAEQIPGNPMGLLDAIALAAQRLQVSRNTQRSLWILTEGGEGSFGRTEEQLIAAAQSAGAQVFVFRPSGPQISQELATLLDHLADQTGGIATTVEDALAIPGAVTRSSISARNQYRLEFIPKGPLHQGYHALSVFVNRPGLPGLEIRSRPGYWVP